MLTKKYKQCGIYCYHNIVNGKNYVGQSVDLCSRKKQFGNKNRIYSGKIFQNAIKKYGKDKFQYSILTHCKPEELNYYEQFYISRLKTTDRRYGYNSTSGGDSQFSRTEDCKENMRKVWTKEKRAEKSKISCGNKNPNYGNKWSIDQKRHGSVVQKEQARKKFYELNGFDVSELIDRVKKFISTEKDISFTKIAKYFHISAARASSICHKLGLTSEMSYSAAIEKHKKPVVQCDINNHEIILNIFPSVTEAVRITGMKSLKHCVCGKQSHGCGYFWRYANNDEKPFETLNKEYFKPTKFYRKVGTEVKCRLKSEGRWKKPTLYKKVYCYNSKGDFVKLYESVTSVEKDGFGKSAVVHCCLGDRGQRTHKNHVFSYTELTREDVLNMFVKHVKKPVIQMAMNGEYIKEWDSATEAANALGLSTMSNINSCCHGTAKSAAGYKWMFKN